MHSEVMQKQGYVGEFEIVDDHRAGKIVIDLIGRINKCGVISPRFDVRAPSKAGVDGGWMGATRTVRCVTTLKEVAPKTTKARSPELLDRQEQRARGFHSVPR